MAGSGDLTGLDLEVGDAVGTGAVGEQQVAVELVGVGADRVGTDDDVADPHGVRLLTLQRALVGHSAAALRLVVVDQQPVFEVLTVVREEQAEQLRVATGAGETGDRVDPHQVAAQGDDHRLEPRVAADAGHLVLEVDGVVVPVLEADQRELGAVTEVDLDVGGVGRRTDVVDDDGRRGEPADVDGQMAVRRPALAAHDEADRRVELGVGRDGDDGRLPDALEREGGDPFDGAEGRADAVVLPWVYVLDRHTGRRVDVDDDLAVAAVGQRLEQPAETPCRRETPCLFATGRDRERRHSMSSAAFSSGARKRRGVTRPNLPSAAR